MYSSFCVRRLAFNYFLISCTGRSGQVEELGLESEAIGISSDSPAAKKRLIFADNKLHELPAALSHLIQTRKPFSQPLISLLLAEVFKPRFQLDADEDISVYDFMDQRLGREAADYISDPMCRGITAGDCRKISLRSLFPDVYRKSLARGSIVRGMIFEKALPVPDGLNVWAGRLSDRSKKEKWIAWSLREGLQRFPQQLSHKLTDCENVEMLTSKRISKIEFRSKKAEVTLESESGPDTKLDAFDVFSTIPSVSLSASIDPEDTHLKSTLNKITFVDVAVACLQFEGKDALTPDSGFGFLTPSFEKTRVLGVTFDSCSFPQHDAGHDITRVTCMMGGEWFSRLFSEHSDDQMLAEAEDTVRTILGFRSKLMRSSFRVHRNCIPQYYLNHHKVVRELKKALDSRCQNFCLLGSSYEGVSVNDVIFNARKAVHEFARRRLQQ